MNRIFDIGHIVKKYPMLLDEHGICESELRKLQDSDG